LSQENVEIVRSAIAAWNRGDMDAVRGAYDEAAIIVRTVEGWPEPGPIVGRDAVMRFFASLRETYSDEDTVVGLSFTDARDRVVVRQIWQAKGRGPDMDMDVTAVFTLRDARIFLLEYFWDHADALKAVGLVE
jgi:ketosteroid isomerase-like protein